MKRIKEREAECRKLNSTVSSLLEQDAKKRGEQGTEHIKPMSRKQAGQAISYVAKQFNQLGAQITKAVDEPE